jgi:Domain of unknown function (DUF397)
VNISGGRGRKRTRRKRTRTDSTGRVEVMFVDGRIALRDSTDPDGPVLRFTPAEWEAFVGGVRRGEFELSPLARSRPEEGGPSRPGPAAPFA